MLNRATARLWTTGRRFLLSEYRISRRCSEQLFARRFISAVGTHDNSDRVEKLSTINVNVASSTNAEDQPSTDSMETKVVHSETRPDVVPSSAEKSEESTLASLLENLGECCGCGTTLQIKKSTAPGYLPEHVVQNIMKEVDSALELGMDKVAATTNAINSLVCMRCHQLAHNGKAKGDMQNVVADDFRHLLKKHLLNRTERKAIIIKVVDLLDFNSSVLEDYCELIGLNIPTIIVANKFDLLPKGVSRDRIRYWVKHQVAKLKINLVDVHVASSLSGDGVEALIEGLNAILSRKSRDVFVLGTTNSGKSTLINQLMTMGFIRGIKRGNRTKLKRTKGEIISQTNPIPVTSSAVAGTTLNLIRFIIRGPASREKLMLFDTPGICRNMTLHRTLSSEDIELLNIRNRIRPVTYRVAAGQSLLLGALARLDFTNGGEFLFTMYTSHKVSLHRTKTLNVERLLSSHVGKLLYPPSKAPSPDVLPLLSNPTKKKFNLKISGWERSSHDIVFDGIGWISITGMGSVYLEASSCSDIHQRTAMMPFDFKTTTRKFYG